MIDINMLCITNYSHPNCTPLQNIMRLSKEEAFCKARELAMKEINETCHYIEVQLWDDAWIAYKE